MTQLVSVAGLGAVGVRALSDLRGGLLESTALVAVMPGSLLRRRLQRLRAVADPRTIGTIARGALFASTALVGVTSASPVAAQIAGSVSGSGIPTYGGTTGGVLVTNTNNGGTTINGLQVNNTTGSPTIDGYKQTSQDGQSVVFGNTGANVLSTSQSGGAGIDLQTTGGGNLSWGISQADNASTLNLTGSYGIYASVSNGFINIVDLSSGGGGGLKNITANGSAVAGIYGNSSGGTGLQVGAPIISGFATGIDGRSSSGVTVTTTGGSIGGATTGINAASTSTTGTAVTVSSGSAITASNTGISAISSGGAISVATVAGGTINGGSTGINISGATGTNATTLTIGAAIGDTAAPNGFGVNYSTSGGNATTNLVTVNANVSGGAYGIATQSASVGVTVASGVTITGGAFGLVMGGTSSLNNAGTIRSTLMQGGTSALNVASATLMAVNTGLITGNVGVSYLNGMTLTNGAGGVITGTGGTAIGASTSTNAAANISLLAGSAVNGAIALSNGADTLQLYNGRGANTGGALNAATFGSVDLGGGANTLVLRGVGDDRTGAATGNGAAATIDTSTIANVTNLSKQDAGTWLLTGSAAYAGTTTIAGGTLVESNTASALGNGGVSIASGATLEFANTTGLLYTKGTTFTGAGTIKFTGNQSTAIGYGGNGNTVISLSSGGLIDVEGGIVNGSSSNRGFYTGNQGSLNIAAGAVFDGVEGDVIVDKLTGSGTLRGGYGTSGSTTIGVADGSSSFTGTITDDPNPGSPLKLIKVGTGNITLNASSSYTGGTTISAGQLSTTSLTGLGTGAITDNAALLFQTGTGTIANAIGGTGTLYAYANGGTQTYAGALTGGLGLSVGANGLPTNVLLGNSANTRTGATTIAAGSTLQGSILALTSGAVTDNGALTFAGASGSYGAAIGGNGSVTVGLANGNTLTLTGANSYSGGTMINAGAILQGKAGTSPATRTLANVGAITDNGTLAFVQGGQAGTYTPNVTGSGVVTISGLTGTNAVTFAGALTNTAGLTLGTTGNATISGSVSNASTTGAVAVTGAGDILAVTSTGSVTSTQTAVTNYASAVYGTGATFVVNNAGTISAPTVMQVGTNPTYGSTGIYATNGVIVNNTGNIYGIPQGTASYRSDGVLTFGDSVVNNTAAAYTVGTTYANGALPGATAGGGVITGGWDGAYITGNGTVYNSGTIAGNVYDGVQIQGNGAITNYVGGRIVGVGAGSSGAAQLQGAGTITNSGQIVAGLYNSASGAVAVGTSGNGVNIGSGSVINNAGGQIVGGSTNTGGNDYGVLATGAVTITNNGPTVVNGINTVAAGKIVGGYTGVELDAGGTVSNYGLIGSGSFAVGDTGTTLTSGFIQGGQDGIRLFRAGGTVNNYAGSAIEAGASGIYIEGSNTTTTAQNASVTNAGLITATNGIYAAAGTMSQVALAVNNQTGGIITATNGNAVYNSNGAINLTNAGTIQQTGTGGNQTVNLSGTLTLTNSGTISNAATNGNYGIYVNGTLATTSSNSGTIVAGANSYGLYVTGTTGLTNTGGTIVGGIEGLYSAGTATIVNTGLIGAGSLSGGTTGTFTAAATNVSGSGTAIALAAGGSVVNAGTIQGSTGTTFGAAHQAGIYNSGGNTTTVTVDNSGSIAGGVWGIAGGAGNVAITNRAAGTISGTTNNAVYAGGGAGSSITNAGMLTGGNAGIYADGTGLAVNNTGMIRAVGGNANTVSSGIYASNTGAQITNSGTIDTTITNGRGIYLAGGGATITNQSGGTIGGNGTGAAILLGGTGNTVNLSAGSIANGLVDGSATTGDTNVYTVAGALNGGLTAGSGNDTITRVTGSTVSGVIDGGVGNDTLVLAGTGSTNQSVANLANIETITKQDAGIWTLTDAATPTVAAATINAGIGGTPGSGGLLTFNGTSGLIGAINVNGATIRAATAGAFGTGTITTIDPTIQYGATGTYANAIVLASAMPGSDPTNIQADNGVNATLSGNISEAIAGQPLVINVAGSTGTITLTGSNSYTGLTMVAGGTLAVNGTNVSGVTVASGATLTGTGSVGATTIADNGNLTGTQGSTLTMASLGLTSGSMINATFGAPNGTALFAVNGNLTLDGTVNVADTGAFGFGVYRLISYGGTLTDNGLAVGTVPMDAQRVTVQTAVAGQVNIVDSSSTLQFWDGGNPALYNNGQINGGSGTWTTTSPTFTDANGLYNGAMTPQPGLAVFEAAPGTVTVDNSAGAIAVTGMQFASNGYVVTGGAIGLADPSGTTAIRVGDGTNAGAGYTATIASALTGASGLNKTDLGTLILSGANSYTGTTTVSGGVLQGTTTNIVGSNIVDNATLAYNQAASGTVIQNISGSGVVTVTGLGAGNALTFAGTDTQTRGFVVTDASNTVFTGTATGAANEVTLQGAGATLTNAANATISGVNAGVTAAAGSTINNAGTIAATAASNISTNAAVILAASPTSIINNTGSISGANDGVVVNGGGRINNAGTISGGGTGNGVIALASANALVIANSGSITGPATAGTGYWGVAFENASGTLVNTGLVQGDEGLEVTTGNTSVVNGATGTIAGTTYGVQTAGTSALALNSYGTITGNSSILGTGANALSLQAGSSTGAITTGAGADTLGLYTGSVTTAAVVDATTGLTVQNAGTHGAATYGAINLGTGANVLALRGAGDGTAANGSGGSLALNSVTNVPTITKRDTGTWTLTGAATPSVAAAAINAGVGGTTASGGLLVFAGTGLTGAITVNGATIRATTGTAFGTGTINELAAVTQFAATATYANNFVLQSTTVPTSFQTVGTGITATLSGAITQGAGATAQLLTFGSIDANGNAATGTFVLTNAGNASTGVTTVNAGTTLRGTTATLSGGSFTDNGVLNFNQGAAGTSAKAIAGTGTVLIDGGGPVTLTGAITASGGVQIGANTTATLSNVSGNGNTTVFLSGDNAVLNVAQGGTIAATNGGAVFGTAQNGTVTNAGTVTSTGNFSAIYFNPNLGTATVTNTGNVNAFGSAVYSGAGTVLTVNNTGTLTSVNRPAVFAAGAANVTNGAGGTINGFFGVYANGALTLANAGQITAAGAGGNAVTANGGGTIVNTGTVSATTQGGWGVQMSGAGTVDNQGTINADSGLVATTGAGVSFSNEGTITGLTNGVLGYNGTPVVLTNSGTITGGAYGVQATAAGSAITNNGTIAGSASGAIGVAMAGGTLANRSGGTISAGQTNGVYGTAIQLSGTGNVLALQAGSTVNGSIDASATTDGSNSYTFSGALNGGFTGGSGNDTVTLVTPVTVTGPLDGGAGTDTLVLDGTGAGTLGSAQVANFENGVKQGSGTWTLTGTTAASPTVFAINAGTLAVAGGNALADTSAITIASAGTLQLNASETIGSLSGAGNVTLGANTLTTGGLNASPTFSGVIAGSGGLTKVGTGTLTLSGANTYTGATMVNAGTLALGASNVIADASAVGVATGATLNLGANSDTVASIALSGTLAGTGTLTAATYTLNGGTVNANLGAGTLTQAGGASVLNGTAGAASVNVNGGTLALGASNRLADNATVMIANGAILDLGANSDTVGLVGIAGALNGTGTLTAAEYDLSGATVNANLGAGNLFQVAGISTLNGTAGAANVTVNAGTLVLGASNRLADAAAVAVATGATLNLGANSDTVGTLALNGTLSGTGTLTASTYTLNNAAVNANLGTGTLVQAGGTSVLSGMAATGTVAVMAGTLRLGASDRIADTAMLGVASGATFDLAGYNETVGTLAGSGTLALGAGTLSAGGTNADYAFGGNVTGTGDLTKVGTGTFSLIGNEGVTGRLNVNAGTLMLAGTTAGSVRVQGGTLTGASAIAGNLLLSSGTLSPGIATQPVAAIQAGSLTVTGGTTVFDFGGMASGFTADLLKVTGAATLTGGTVTTRGLDGSANYKMEQTYTVLTSGALTGTYASGSTFTQVSNNSDLYYRLRYDLVANGVVLEVRKPVDFTTTLGTGATGNQLAIAGALNGGVLTGSDAFVTALNAISQLTPDQRRSTLDTIGGESIADISTSVALVGNRFNELLRQRIAVGAAGNSADPSLIAGIAGGKRGLDQVRASGQVGAEGSSFADGHADNHAGAWVQTFGGAGTLDGLNGTASIKDQSYGVAAGIDAKVAGLSIGGAFAASALDTWVEGRSATNRGTLYQGGGYVAYDDGTAYASAVGSYFSGTVTSTRQVAIGTAFQGTAIGTPKVTGYTAGGSVGYRVVVGGGVRFTPQASVQATHVERDAFTETGAGVLSLSAARDVRTLYTATAEGRLSYLSAAPGGIVEPYVGAGAAFAFGDLNTLSANRFTGAPTGTGAFSVTGARLSPTTALVNGGIEAHPNDRVTLGMGVEGRLSNRQRDGRVELHVRLGF